MGRRSAGGLGRTERLLALLGALRSARIPLSFEQLHEQIPGAWEGPLAARRRTFERDKLALRELGVLVRWDAHAAGYALDPESSKLRNAALGAEERALLRQAAALVAADPASPFAPEVQGAMLRLAGGELPGPGGAGASDGDDASPVLLHHPTQAEGPDFAERLARLAQAVWRRLVTEFRYRRGGALSRPYDESIEPWGLYVVRGHWYVVGRCPGRDAQRTYRVGRMEGVRVPKLPDGAPQFERPAGFDLRATAQRHPWDWDEHEPRHVVLRAEEPIARAVARALGGDATLGQAARGEMLVRRTVTSLDGLRPLLIDWMPRLVPEAPAALVQAWSRPLRALRARHSGTSP
jgi:predicted DNA-binding transcriptional regulator YafY